eukprot:340216-Chlamydomonas_euryale.AAC.1
MPLPHLSHTCPTPSPAPLAQDARPADTAHLLWSFAAEWSVWAPMLVEDAGGTFHTSHTTLEARKADSGSRGDSGGDNGGERAAAYAVINAFITHMAERPERYSANDVCRALHSLQ